MDYISHIKYLKTVYPNRYKKYSEQVYSIDDKEFTYKSMNIFGERLRKERKNQNLSSTDIASVLDVSRSYIYYIENRNKILERCDKRRNISSKRKLVRREPFRFWILAISIILDVSPVYMMGITNDKEFSV